MRFSVVVVCLNSGDRLQKTIDSIYMQSHEDYEIIVKDGLSTDGSVEKLVGNEKLRIIRQKDKSIYDAMNQAITYVTGDYIIFLNTGDVFAGSEVLKSIDRAASDAQADIVYGDMAREGVKGTIPSPTEITDSVCYRNIPCHQACFYRPKMFEAEGYRLQYAVRADYEHFLRCKYEYKATFKYVPCTVAIYEGNGFSETGENEKRARAEHKEITAKYLGSKCIKYRLLMLVTLQPLRKKMAESKGFSGVYNRVKGIFR